MVGATGSSSITLTMRRTFTSTPRTAHCASSRGFSRTCRPSTGFLLMMSWWATARTTQNVQLLRCQTAPAPLGARAPLFPGPLMPATGRRIDSQANFEFQYGRLEFRARMARGDWLWPGLWMMPHESLFGGWPDDGEIDIIETRGNPDERWRLEVEPPGFLKSNQSAGRDVLLSTLHYMGNVFWKAQGHGLGVDWTEDYHTFGLYWSDEEMYTYYLDADDQEVLMIDLSARPGRRRQASPRRPWATTTRPTRTTRRTTS
ncbi:unnamed protein product [Heterosigma akashiwo]